MKLAFRALLVLVWLASSISLSAQDPPKPEDVVRGRLAADTAAKAAYPKVHGPLKEALLSPTSLSRPSSTSPESPTGLLAVTVRSTNAAEVLTHLSSLGRQPANVLETIIEAYLSPTDVAALATQPFVVSLEAIQPRRPRLISQGAPVHNAVNWHDGGYTGAGVKVGIIDDFDGLLSLMGTELPASIVGRCYTSVGIWSSNLAACDTVSPHGTAVAESLVDVAPGVQLFIANPISRVDFANSVNWFLTQGVTVINYSGAWLWDGPGNGTSPYADSPLQAVDVAVFGGATFVTAAGNEGESTWLGAWRDAWASDNIHEFSTTPASAFNGVVLNAGDTLVVQLRWQDSWGGASRDLDIRLWDPSTSSFVAGSLDSQNGGASDTVPERGFARRLLGRPVSKEAAFIELRNLLAVTPFEQVRDSDVAAILAKARLLPRDVGHHLMTVYEQAALWLLSDHHISEVDRRALQRLQTAFELSDAAATAATERAASALYERALREALADGVFEPSERKRLDALVLGLGLSEERAFAAYAPIAKEAVQRTVSDAIVDRRYTADEERRVEELARVLDVKMTLSDETSAVLAHYRTLAAIDAGHLPDVPVPSISSVAKSVISSPRRRTTRFARSHSGSTRAARPRASGL